MPNKISLAEVCASLINDNDRADFTNITLQIALKEKPQIWETWGIGLLCVTVTAFAAAIGVAFMPLLSAKAYERTLSFLVSLGVGTLTGSAVFIMLPQAFHVTSTLSYDFLSKSWLALGGIFLFFIVDRILKLILELKRRAKKKKRLSQVAPVAVQMTEMEQAAPAAETASDSCEHKTSIVEAFCHDKQAHATCTHSYGDDIEKYKEGDSPIASVAYMVLFGDGLHNLVDGMSMGAAFADSPVRGVSVAISILAQEFPQEIGDLAILISSGMGLKKALLYNLISAGASYCGFITGVFLDALNEQFDDVIFAVSGGMFLYISLASMIPEMSRKVDEQMKVNMKEGLLTTFLQILGISSGMLFVFFMSIYGGDIRF
uniref:Zinc transporter ZIP14 n=1 Tax=Plectus sambesii TaxID=2011161 RepID=A0A914VSE8_9BILA